ncbi:MAG: S1 family peptidase [Stackebrandtia sp.]
MSRKAKRLAGLGVAAAAGLLIAGAAAAPVLAESNEANGDDVGTYVVGGEDAPEGEYPWMVRLSMGCGGSLITEQVVLTAAHCVDGTGEDTSITAQYGSVDLENPDIQTYTSQYVHQSETYTSDNRGDWALIKLSEPVADAQLVPMASDDASDQGDFQIMGWGATSEGGEQQQYLQHATVPHVDAETCNEAYGGEVDVEGEICAGIMDAGGVDTCQGDSGGPMVSYASGEPVQVGIVSWGNGCARPNYPGVYAKVSHWNADITTALDGLP